MTNSKNYSLYDCIICKDSKRIPAPKKTYVCTNKAVSEVHFTINKNRAKECEFYKINELRKKRALSNIFKILNYVFTILYNRKRKKKSKKQKKSKNSISFERKVKPHRTFKIPSIQKKN
ncbi:MAG: hypothetical protein HWN67_01910 [Candidatus Helarchaeota archaeon]|nr:hypothetical protein [Candidatus Helarchaeota archaeon]